MKPHQQRVVEERVELSDRLQKLIDFFDNPIFWNLDPAEQARLREQAAYMAAYSDVLKRRIAAF